MNVTEKADTVWFTTKGQVVIPLRLRKQFQIEDGTKAVVQATPEGILLKPVTKWAIDRGFGLLKRKPGDKALNAFGLDMKAEMGKQKSKVLTPAVWQKLAARDSDHDKKSNKIEVAAGTLPGDPKSKP